MPHANVRNHYRLDQGRSPKIGDLDRNRCAGTDVLRCSRRLGSKPSKNDQTLTLAMPKPRGAAAAVLVIAPGTPDERRIEIGSATLTIGSDADARICVSDPHVSRRHAEVARVDTEVVVRDL